LAAAAASSGPLKRMMMVVVARRPGRGAAWAAIETIVVAGATTVKARVRAVSRPSPLSRSV
jgi:hypothetical protein